MSAVVLKTIAYRVASDGVTFMIKDSDGQEVQFLVEARHLTTLMARIASAAADARQFLNDDEGDQVARVMVADRVGVFETSVGPGVLLRLENGAKLPVVLPGEILDVLHEATGSLLQGRKPRSQ